MKLKTNVIKFEMIKGSEKILCECAILDKIAMFKFSKKGVAQECYDYERNHSRVECKFDRKRDVYSEIYRDKNRAELTAFIKDKLVKAGAKEIYE